MLKGTSTDRNLPNFCCYYLFKIRFSAPFTTKILKYCASRLLIINYLFSRLLLATQMLGFDYLLISHGFDYLMLVITGHWRYYCDAPKPKGPVDQPSTC